MVMSVTRIPARAGMLRSLFHPQAFLGNLPKANGDRINVSWPVRNASLVAPAYATVRIGLFGASNDFFQSGLFSVPPGAALVLPWFADVAGRAAGATINGELVLQEHDALAGFIRTVETHTFSIQIL